jgi:hypothetical protein
MSMNVLTNFEKNTSLTPYGIVALRWTLVKGEGFAVDASVMEANASRYHGKAPEELDWTEKQRQKRAVAEYLVALEGESEPKSRP